MSGPNESKEPPISSNPSDNGDKETGLKNEIWTDVTAERKKAKIGSKTPRPGTVKTAKNQKKFLIEKRGSSDLHSVSSAISAALNKKKFKIASQQTVQTMLTAHFQKNTSTATSRAMPGTAVVPKKTPPAMSLKPKPASPTTTTTIKKPTTPTNDNYDDNITKNLKKINPKINRSKSSSPVHVPISETKSTATNQDTNSIHEVLANKEDGMGEVTETQESKQQPSRATSKQSRKNNPSGLSPKTTNFGLHREQYETNKKNVETALGIKKLPTKGNKTAPKSPLANTYEPKTSPPRKQGSPSDGSRTLARAMSHGSGRGSGHHAGRSPFSIGRGGGAMQSHEVSPIRARSVDTTLGVEQYTDAFTAMESFDKHVDQGNHQKHGFFGHPGTDNAPADQTGGLNTITGSPTAKEKPQNSANSNNGKQSEEYLFMSTRDMRNLKDIPIVIRDFVQRRLEEGTVDLEDMGDVERYGNPAFRITPEERRRLQLAYRRDGTHVFDVPQKHLYLPQHRSEDDSDNELLLTPPPPPIKPKAARPSFASMYPSSDDGSDGEELAAIERFVTQGKAKTPESEESSQDSSQSQSIKSTPQYTEVTHYVDPTEADTSSLGLDRTMDTAADPEGEDEDEGGQVFEDDNVHVDSDFQAEEEEAASATTEQQDNHDSDSSSCSDDYEEVADCETRCPEPQCVWFHRYDAVVNIQKNNNPIDTVATLIVRLMQVISEVDADIMFFPYRASYELPPLGMPSELMALGNELYKYVDKGKFERFSSRPVENCRLSIALGSSVTPDDLCDGARDRLYAINMQLYPKLLNFPSVVRAGFLLYSHKLHHSATFQRELSSYISRPVASKWRRAAATIDLHPDDRGTVDGKQAFIPSAICIECQEQDLPLVRVELQRVYPLRPKPNRFEYPRQVKASFCNTFNRYELDQVDELSKEIAKSLWHVQKLTNLRERYASIAPQLRKPYNYEALVRYDNDSYPSVRRLLLELTVPYKDSRGEHPAVFTSCDHVIPFDSTTLDVGVTYRPQHAKYAQNVLENMALHFEHQSGCSQQYLVKVFRQAHLFLMSGRKWHEEHKKAYDPKHTQEGLSSQDLSHAMAEFNLDISVVLQDAAMAVSRAAAVEAGEEVSAPKAASNASQQLSMMNSIETLRAPEEELEEAPVIDQITAAQQPQSGLKKNSWAVNPAVATTRISQTATTITATSSTLMSVDSPSTQTATIQEDSSLTTATEQHGMTEAQVRDLIAAHETKWQANIEKEVTRRLAEQREADYQQHLARKALRNQTQVQTAQSPGGGQLP
jgi:hypothetical protein